MLSYIKLFFLFSLVTSFLGTVYMYLWRNLNNKETTPVGFGIFLPLILSTYFFLTSDLFFSSFSYILIIFLGGLIYLIDDIKELNYVTRIFLAFIFGLLLFIVEFQDISNTNIFLILFLIIFLGISSVGLTNMMNFYDGADLNMALIIMLTGIILFFFTASNDIALKQLGIVMCSFAVGFGVLNSKPKTLYIGDSGSFIIALFYLYFFISYINNKINIPLELISVLALPFFDVLYVMLIRLYCKHDMLSRNYLHLYQRIHIRYGGFYHLIPQIINVIAIIFLYRCLEPMQTNNSIEFLIACILITPFFYIICRLLFVEKSYFFGDGK